MEIYASLFRGVKAHHLISSSAQLAQQPNPPSISAAPGDGFGGAGQGRSGGSAGAARSNGPDAQGIGGSGSGSGTRDPLKDARQVRAAAAAKRHGRFGGVFVKRGSAEDQTHSVVVGNPKKDSLPVIRAPAKTNNFQKKKPKEGPVAKPGLSTLAGLKAGLEGLLDGGYNRLMGVVRKQLEPGLGISRLDRPDFLHFFYLAHLATGFVRLQQETSVKEKRAKQKENRSAEEMAGAGTDGKSPFLQISATMGWDTFAIVQKLWLSTIDLPTNAPEKDWDMQASALRLLKEMLFTLDMAQLVGSAADRQASDRLQRRLLHDDQKESGLLPVRGRLIKDGTAHQGASKGEEGNQSQDAAAAASPAASGPASGPASGRDRHDPFEEAEMEELAEEKRRLTKEVAYDLLQRLRQELAFPAVVHFYTWLLRGYSTNGSFLNHCLLSFLKRIAAPEALNLEAMLYQLSVLRIFHQMLGDAAFRKQSSSGPLLHFSTSIVRNLFKRLAPPAVPPVVTPQPAQDHPPGDDEAEAESHPTEEDIRHAEAERRREAQAQEGLSCMMFVELLFWKNSREAMDIRNEYHWRPEPVRKVRGRGKHGSGSEGSDDDGHCASRAVFTPAQVDRLVELWEEHGGSAASGKDTLAAILPDFENGSVPKARIARQLKMLGLKRGALAQAQEGRLREGWEKWGGQRQAGQLITDFLGQGVKKSTVNKYLRKLGLRSQGKRAKGQNMDGLSDDASSSDSSGGSGSDSGTHSAEPARKHATDPGAASRPQQAGSSPSQASIDCSEELRGGSVVQQGGESDTAWSNRPAEETRVQGHDPASNEARKRQRKLSKHRRRDQGERLVQGEDRPQDAAGARKHAKRASGKQAKARASSKTQQRQRDGSGSSSEGGSAAQPALRLIAMSDDDDSDVAEKQQSKKSRMSEASPAADRVFSQVVAMASGVSQYEHGESPLKVVENAAGAIHMSERAQGASKARLKGSQRSAMETLRAARQEQKSDSNAGPIGIAFPMQPNGAHNMKERQEDAKAVSIMATPAGD
ncbi:hypothetical protein WJX84_005214 [Apatococcus fuscideae]|uniref:Uncharacterized protein n=1 Tax=Apatococcus fuscideae TaxID=2026836 RepID=A0AAW1T3G9_9CHLO